MMSKLVPVMLLLVAVILGIGYFVIQFKTQKGNKP
jgi:hypothetical protein